ncbi:MAG TPA: hypothetical protein VFD35_10360 [Pricia sp.]|nr:hypothetical protein [Pricia sp.]
MAKEEYDSFQGGNERYLHRQLGHDPGLKLYSMDDNDRFGLPARKLELELETEIFLVPLFGHTLGHCGAAFGNNGKWMFYVGDAYYLREEIKNLEHPIDHLATIRAADNDSRNKSLDAIRGIVKKHNVKIEYFGYHDPTEFINFGQNQNGNTVTTFNGQ